MPRPRRGEAWEPLVALDFGCRDGLVRQLYVTSAGCWTAEARAAAEVLLDSATRLDTPQALPGEDVFVEHEHLPMRMFKSLVAALVALTPSWGQPVGLSGGLVCRRANTVGLVVPTPGGYWTTFAFRGGRFHALSQDTALVGEHDHQFVGTYDNIASALAAVDRVLETGEGFTTCNCTEEAP